MITASNIETLISKSEEALAPMYKQVDHIALANQKKVLDAFHQHQLSDECFIEKTGYGRNDFARETMDKIFATVFQAQSAAVHGIVPSSCGRRHCWSDDA